MNFKNDNKNIGENIRLYRIKSGLTIKELSKQMLRLHNITCKSGSLRNYEKGTEKIPAVSLNSIAAITRTDIQQFYEPAHESILLDTSHKIHLLEAYSMISCRASRDTLLHLARKLSKVGGSNV